MPKLKASLAPSTTFNYICLNDKCINHSHQHIKKLESERDAEELCLDCLAPMKLMGEILSGSIGGKFACSTPEQRKQMLLERSSKHFKTSGLADRKRAIGEQYKREALSMLKESRR